MTVREAIQFLRAGYGDDCPAGGWDEYLEAMLALADADLIDWDTDVHSSEKACRWPRPDPSPFMLAYADLLRSYYDAEKTVLLDTLVARSTAPFTGIHHEEPIQ